MVSGYKTFVGIAVAAAPTLAHLFGYQLAPSFSAQFPELVDVLMQIVGLAIAAYGRMKAEVPGWLVK